MAAGIGTTEAIGMRISPSSQHEPAKRLAAIARRSVKAGRRVLKDEMNEVAEKVDPMKVIKLAEVEAQQRPAKTNDAQLNLSVFLG